MCVWGVGHNLIEIGFTYLPKPVGVIAPPPFPVPTALMCKEENQNLCTARSLFILLAWMAFWAMYCCIIYELVARAAAVTRVRPLGLKGRVMKVHKNVDNKS